MVVISAIAGGAAWIFLSGKNNTMEEPATKEYQPSFLMDTAKDLYDKDKDFDGLSDIDEATYKTDVNSPDTDADGLLDRDEIFIHKTDPLKPDTDGDGKNDGYEVLRETDPLKK